MTTSRRFFEMARDASRDAERCRSQLVALESRAKSLGGGGFQPKMRSTPDPHRMERKVDAYVDRERALEGRMQADYVMIDDACAVLYGDDAHRGLDSVQSPAWADVLWWKYLDDATWDAVAVAVGYSKRMCMELHNRALAWMDEVRFRSDLIDRRG